MKSVHAPIILVPRKKTISNISKGISLTMRTVKLYEASSLPIFLVVTCAVPI